MTIRKDSKVTARTSSNVLVLGTVLSVKKDTLFIETGTGNVIKVLKTTATKLSSTDFKLAVLESSQPKLKINNTIKTNKKQLARVIFNKLNGQKRKVVIAAFMNEANLSAPGANTYFQNFKSGIWQSA